MILIFQFAHNPETRETAFSGNIDPQAALGVLQSIVIANAVREAQEKKDVSEPSVQETKS